MASLDTSERTTDEQAELTRISRALDPDFKILGELGRGGMGVVYLAVDVNLEREVAIKVLPPYLARETGVRERFLREARTAARLTHPNIVPVYRADEIGGVVFFVMRHVDGESLADRLAKTRTLSPLEVARVMKPVALALDYAHSRGVIHRDIKPENILLERGSDTPVVTDFGIARLMEAAPQTATGQVLGTVLYMSPEQVMAERVDGRSDVYSLGIVGFKALTASLPFENRTATAVLVDRVTKDAPRVREAGPEVPAALADVIDRCLLREADARYQTGSELATALEEASQAIERSSPAARYPASTPEMIPTLEQHSPEIISEREAKAVWTRAAELQAETGVQSALRSLPASLGPPTAQDRRTLTSGYRMSAVREAANEVGIPEKYIARAQQELGLAGADNARVATHPTGMKVVRGSPLRNNIWLGAPSRIIYEIEVPKEVRPDTFELLVNTIQRTMGDPGHVTTLGRSLHWASAHQQRRLQISMVPRGGRTTIRADEGLQQVIGGLFGGVVGGGGGGIGGGMALPLTIALTHDPVAGFGAFGATALAAYLAARGIYRQVRRSRERDLINLVDELAAEIMG
ncbi:MAG: serine/threonine-protein kinase [Gemmatimonadaceae bacterium]